MRKKLVTDYTLKLMEYYLHPLVSITLGICLTASLSDAAA